MFIEIDIDKVGALPFYRDNYLWSGADYQAIVFIHV